MLPLIRKKMEGYQVMLPENKEKTFFFISFAWQDKY
jgi:hypothetical protein